MPQMQFSYAYRTNDAVIQQNRLSTLPDLLDGAVTYLFASNPPDAGAFATSGNNVIGILYSFDASGAVLGAYEGAISRQIKENGRVEAFQFYGFPSDSADFNRTPSLTVLLDVGGKSLSGGVTYGTSSDFKPSSLTPFITANPTVSPPQDTDLTPDPDDGTVDLVPQQPGDDAPDEITQVNAGEGEILTFEVRDPDGTPVDEEIEVFVSDDGGETWTEYTPGDEIVAGEEDVLIAVGQPDDPGSDDVVLIINPGEEDEIETIVDTIGETPIPGGPDTTPDPIGAPIEILEPEDFNAASPDAVIILNTAEGETFVIDISDQAAPGSESTTGLDDASVLYSTDGGQQWREYMIGDEITAGQNDVLVAVNIQNEKYEGNGRPQQFQLTAVSDNGDIATAFVRIVDDGAGVVTADITKDTVDYAGANIVDAPRENGLPQQYVYDGHGAICVTGGIDPAVFWF